MFSTIRRDSDAVVFMFKPDQDGAKISDVEQDIMDKIEGQLGKNVSRKSVYVVVNKKGGLSENYNKQVEKITSDVRKWNVADSYLVNCFDDREVSEKLLSPLLESISRNIEDVDMLLLQRVSDKAQALYKEYDVLCGKMGIPEITNSLVGKNSKESIEISLAGIYKKVFVGEGEHSLKAYCRKLFELKETGNTEFANALKETVDSCFTALTSEERVKEMLDKGEAAGYIGAMIKALDMTRVEIIKRFLSLDKVLANIVENCKMKVIRILAEDGKLGNIVLLAERDSSSDWLGNLLEKIDPELYPSIHDALSSFRDFKISMQGELVYKVRNALTPIDHTITGKVPYVNPEGDLNEAAKQIRYNLEMLIDNIQTSIRNETTDLPKIPDRALYAVVRDLQERLQYDMKENYHSTELEFRHFYEQYQSDILKEEYAEILKNSNFYKKWQGVVAELKRYDKSENFAIA